MVEVPRLEIQKLFEELEKEKVQCVVIGGIAAQHQRPSSPAVACSESARLAGAGRGAKCFAKKNRSVILPQRRRQRGLAGRSGCGAPLFATAACRYGPLFGGAGF